MSEGEALLALLQELKRRDYDFTTVTPATHARVLARASSGPASLRDIFGWNRPFSEPDLGPELLRLLKRADAVETRGTRLRSKVRVARLGGDLFLHSAFPTEAEDSVFLGPDTYRFARFLEARMPGLAETPAGIVDMGAGSGAGGILASRLIPGAKITLVDVNPSALRLAEINARAASVEVTLLRSDRLPAGADLIVANPPYMIDAARRSYRDGGDSLGGAVALDWCRQALAAGAAMLLYTGAAFVRGRAPLIEALQQVCGEAGATLEFEEIDPDVFGEELDQPEYADVERIAAIGAIVTPTRR